MANSKANPEELREILDAVGVTVDGIDQADDDSIIVEGVEDDDDEIVEDKTLLAMKSYMEMASAHMTNKMYTKENEKKSQRNIVASGQIGTPHAKLLGAKRLAGNPSVKYCPVEYYLTQS